MVLFQPFRKCCNIRLFRWHSIIRQESVVAIIQRFIHLCNFLFQLFFLFCCQFLFLSHIDCKGCQRYDYAQQNTAGNRHSSSELSDPLLFDFFSLSFSPFFCLFKFIHRLLLLLFSYWYPATVSFGLPDHPLRHKLKTGIRTFVPTPAYILTSYFFGFCLYRLAAGRSLL